jgi:hypothetical protein
VAVAVERRLREPVEPVAGSHPAERADDIAGFLDHPRDKAGRLACVQHLVV